MKQYIMALVLCVMLCVGLTISPSFVVAQDTCYVDKDADDNGDGSDDEPYQDIEEALDEECTKIIVSQGTYGDAVTIGKGVSVTGKSRDSVKITAAVKMEDGASLSDVTVSTTSGIDVAKDAEVDIEDVAIIGANVGIETVVGNGKVTLRNSKIYDGNKGLYLQSGNTTKITGCEIYNNDEEGIDIRSNVDGSITGNTISNNGESGIEVILGKADLLISDNKLKKNGASGIATQYYKGMGKSGAVKIKNNTITDNSDYGMNCKVPSGGNPVAEFWGASLNMSSNKLSGNKDGDFAPECALSEGVITDASTTQKQKDAAAKAKYEADQKVLAEAQRKKEGVLKGEEKTQEEEKQQELMREQLQKNEQSYEQVRTSLSKVSTVYIEDQSAWEQAKKRNTFVMFLIGPKKKELQKIVSNGEVYKTEIANAQQAMSNITDQEKRAEAQSQIDDYVKKQKDLQAFVETQNKEFSLFGWIFN